MLGKSNGGGSGVLPAGIGRRIGRFLAAWRGAGRMVLALCLSLAALACEAAPEPRPMRIGINASVLKQHPQALADWERYLSARVKRPVTFVNRETYREMIDVIKNREVEFAWLSDFPYIYLANDGHVKLLATPVARNNALTYGAYLLVPASDTRTRGIADLRGRVFAFTDRYSLTGYQVARHWLQQLGERDPARFFRKTLFTHSHRNTITAVASGLADGGTVDSYAWDMAIDQEPSLAAQLRIVTRSVDFGFPPVVVLPQVSARDAATMRDALLTMARDAEGSRLLQAVGLADFIIGDPRRYSNLPPILESSRQP